MKDVKNNKPKNLATSNNNVNTKKINKSSTKIEPIANKKKEYFFMLKKRTLKTVLISVCIPLVLFIGAPIDIFVNNYEEFKFAFSDLIPFCLVSFVIFSTIIFAILYFLPKRVYKYVSAIFLGIAFMLWVQQTFLNSEINALSGDGVGSSSVSKAKVILNVIIWMVVIDIFVLTQFFNDKKKIISTCSTILSIIIIATQIIIPISASFTKKDAFISKAQKNKNETGYSSYAELTNANLTTISTSNNIFYFCIDRFDEDYAELAANITYGVPEIYDNLTGFTWFQDNVSFFGHTYPAITQMLTNTTYNPGMSRAEYLNSAYNGKTPLSILNDNGYDINIYTSSFYAYTNASYLPDYVKNKSALELIKITDIFGFWSTTLKLSLYRTLPYILKLYLNDIDSDSYNESITQACINNEYAYDLDNVSIYNIIKDNFKTTNNKNFSFIHIIGCHNVYKNNSNMFGMNINNKSMTDSFNIINLYIDAMKKMGVYDNATIIITGDHGFAEDNLRYAIRTALFFKPSGSSTEPLKTSKAQTSHANIWTTIFESEGIDTTKLKTQGVDIADLEEQETIKQCKFQTNLFDIDQNVNQTRYYFAHTYGEPLISNHYIITGAIDNNNKLTNWKLTKTLTFNNKSLLD